MAGQSNAAPVIIKRKKKIIAGGHHGGAWKVAYADFVTAMMAFFLLMWLLNATTEKQRKGLADFFSPAIPVNRTSAGGEGAFGGDSIFSESTLARNGTGASAADPAADRQVISDPAGEAATSGAEEELLAEVEQMLLARSGESLTSDRLLRHVVTRITDEGLVIELFDLPGSPLFEQEGSTPTQTLRALSALLADVLSATENLLAVNGHSRSFSVLQRENPVWPVTTARAQALRSLLKEDGMPDARFARVVGHADRKLATAIPSAPRNNRMELILLRAGK